MMMIRKTTVLLLVSLVASASAAACNISEPLDTGSKCSTQGEFACWTTMPGGGACGCGEWQCRCNAGANVCSCRGDGCKDAELMDVETQDIGMAAAKALDESGASAATTMVSLLASGALAATVFGL